MAYDMQQVMSKVVSAGLAPALGAVVLTKSGTILDEVVGTINSNDPEAPKFTNDTQIFIQSCTKLITAICALQLIEQGKISMEDPVAKYVPEVVDMKVCEGFDGDKPVLRDAKTTMTIRHLFTHTSGVQYEAEPDMARYRALKGQEAGRTMDLSPEYAYLDMMLDFDPGTGWHYGQNLDLLGFAIEKVSGLRLEEYMKVHVFEPMDMHDTGPEFTQNGQHLVLHFNMPDGLLALPDVKPGTADMVWRRGGGHFLISTMHDYAKVIKMILNEGKTESGAVILKPETVKYYLFRDWLPPDVRNNIYGGEKIGQLKIALKPDWCAPGDIGETFEEDDERGWSCGFMLNKKKGKLGRNVGSGTWGGLSNTYFWIDPVAGIAGLVTSSQMPFQNSDVMGVFRTCEEWAYAQNI